MGEILKLSYINDGKEFELPKLTVEMHDEVLEEAVKFEEKFQGEKLNREINKLILFKVFKSIDKKVKLKDIKEMHPADFVYVFNKVWNVGRELGNDDENFQ